VNKSAYLYINAKGFEVRSHSYSAGQLFHECAQKYKLQRLDGWKERELRASMEFGKAIENAIQAYHSHNEVYAAIEVFYDSWNPQKDRDLKYAPVEKDWQSLALSGEEMIKLYHLRVPLLPFDLSVPPEFQIKYYKEMFPGSDLAGIEFVAYIDMRVHSKLSLGEALGVDIKVMNKAIPEGMLRLDPQICTYAWVTGISDWAFLNFIKQGREIERGDWVAVLEGVGEPTKFVAGQSVVVAGIDKGDEFAPGDLAYIVKDEAAIDALNQAQGYKNGKLEQTNAAKARKLEWLKQNAARVPLNVLTKQRIQFVNGTITREEQIEASRRIGHDISRIVYANQENYWPKEGGIRFPADSCVRCAMRGLCLQNSQLRDSLVVRSDEEWDARQEETQEM
jgi:hypothetical protein